MTNLISEPHVKGVSLSVKRGEIVESPDLSAPEGPNSAEAWLGLRPSNGPFKNYQQAMQSGYFYVSEDRKGKGLVTSMSIQGQYLPGRAPTHAQNVSAFRGHCGADSATYGKKLPDPSLPMSSLSGGNQQKCSIAKWLVMNPKLLILDEPTRGVDVGAKAEIYAIIAQLAQNGMSCIVISSEMPEIIGLCHRAIVFRDGQIAGELAPEALTEANIMRLAAGVKAA